MSDADTSATAADPDVGGAPPSATPTQASAPETTPAKPAVNGDDPFKGTPYEGKKVPDKFVVDKDGKREVNQAAILDSYTELEKQQFRRREEVRAEALKEAETERLKGRPTAPGDYTVGKPTKIGDREAPAIRIGDRDIEILPDDPALNYMKGVAHKYGMPQAEFDQMVQGYIATVMSTGPKWDAEAKILGGEAIAAKREQRVDGFLKGNLSPENYAFFAGMPSTAKAIQAIEQLMTLSGHPPFVPERGDLPGETYDAAQLREMQRDPRYTGQGRPGGSDKAFVSQVRAGFARLAKTGTR